MALRKVIAERKYPFYNGQVVSFTHIVVLNGNLMELFLEFKFPVFMFYLFLGFLDFN